MPLPDLAKHRPPPLAIEPVAHFSPDAISEANGREMVRAFMGEIPCGRNSRKPVKLASHPLKTREFCTFSGPPAWPAAIGPPPPNKPGFSGFFTPEYVGKVLGAARKINPNLGFVPCSYSPRVTPQFAERYRGLIDGILFPYRAELTGANLTDPTLVDAEVVTLKKLLGPSVPSIVDVYASAHSRLGSSTPEYVEEVMNRAIRCADGVHVYCHHSPRDGSQKAQVIKRLFHEWSADPNMPRPRR